MGQPVIIRVASFKGGTSLLCEFEFLAGREPLGQDDFAVLAGGQVHGVCSFLQIIRHLFAHVDSDCFCILTDWICCHDSTIPFLIHNCHFVAPHESFTLLIISYRNYVSLRSRAEPLSPLAQVTDPFL